MTVYSAKKSKIQKPRVENLVRQYNAKITRLEKKNPNMAQFLPKRIKTSDFYNISNYKDFKRRFDKSQRFLKKGSEKLVQVNPNLILTQYEKKEIRYLDIRKKNYKQAKKLKYNISTTKGNMGSIKANNLVYKKYELSNKTREDINKFFEVSERMISQGYDERLAQIHHDNFVQGILSQTGNTEESIKQMEEVIKQMEEGIKYAEGNRYIEIEIMKLYGMTESEYKLYRYLKNMSPQALESAYYNDTFISLDVYYNDETRSREKNAMEILNKLKIYQGEKPEISIFDEDEEDFYM